jgi:Glycosyl hydrolases family 35
MVMQRTLALLAILPALASAQPKFTHPDRIRYDGQCFTIEGKDTFLYSGAFHYFRCPKDLWPARLQQIKDAGFNAIETYVPWNWHEREMPSGINDFSKVDLREFDEFLSLAEKMGFYTIVRPGPYICAEWATGGFPQWLLTKKPAQPKRYPWLRSDDPVYLEWSGHWLRAVSSVLKRHQITQRSRGAKGTILVQIENEYDFLSLPDEAKVTHLRYLAKTLIDSGIDVPLFTCWTKQVRGSTDPILSKVFDNPNQYPRWNVDSIADAVNEQGRVQPWAPKMVTEQQGGWFGGVGGQLAEEQDGIDERQIFALTMRGIAAGQTGINYYMLFGGTNFGDWGAEGQTTSYDYFAPIREWGGGGPKYDAVKAIGDYLRLWGPELARTTEDPEKVGSSAPRVDAWSRIAANGAHYIFVHNRSQTMPVEGFLSRASIAFKLPPFGFGVYRYTSDPNKGQWFANPPKRSGAKPAVSSIRLSEASEVAVVPSHWQSAGVGKSVTDLGIYGSDFVFYRAVRPKTLNPKYLWVKTFGGELVPSLPLTNVPAAGTSTFELPVADVSWTLLNPGYPNFGTGIEAKRGIADLRLLSDLPVATPIRRWRKVSLERFENSATLDLLRPVLDKAKEVDLEKGGQVPSDSVAAFVATVNLAKVSDSLRLSIPSIDDEGVIYVNGNRVAETNDYSQSWELDVAKFLKPGENEIVIVVRNNEGAGGLRAPVALEETSGPAVPVSLEFSTRLESGMESVPYTLDTTRDLPRIEHPTSVPRAPSEGKVVRTSVKFAKPPKAFAWEVILAAHGDGFLRLNGRDLGRYWQVGPQRGFFLPAGWLQETNVLEFTALPHGGSGRIEAAELRPLPEF